MKCPKCHSDILEDSRFCSKCGTPIHPSEKASISFTKTLRTPTKELIVGDVLAGKYRIIEELGRGGMGIVYKAEDLKLHRPVALKFLPPELGWDTESRERFILEARAAAALSHPNICTIHEVEDAENVSFISMEFVEGESLNKRIKKGPLTVERALDIAVQVAEGLEEAHKKGIIHRDIKSANIMVTEKGLAKIMDFGLAKLRGGVSLTKEGTTLGTVAYMSPEQAQGKDVDHHTDIWALGVVLYEMITGDLPFQGEREASMLYSIVHEEPRPFKELKPPIPSEFQQIIYRALRKNPESRYATAAEMVRDLRKYQDALKAEEAGFFNLRSFLKHLLKPQFAITVALAVIAIGFFTFWFFNRQAKIRWAKDELLLEIDQLIEAGRENYIEAYKLAVEAEKYIPHDPKLSEFLSKIAVNISIKTEPPGAKIYMKEYKAPESEWEYMGVSPIEKIRVPFGFFRFKMEKEGYETVLAACSTYTPARGTKRGYIPYDVMRVLDKKESIPPGMVRVKGEKVNGVGEIGDFFIDKYEITNKQFKEFLDKGGYRNQEYWKQKFIKEGKELSREEAFKEFVDQTGRPGPATWQAGDYPEGQDDYPVSGISWYEAAAYGEFVGKSLPTSTHWGIAGMEFSPLFSRGILTILAPLSNFGGKGPASAGSSPGLTSYGAYDMAGNVREWCWNETPKGRIIRGGAWNDATYMFANLSQASPFDRSPKNGFRCVFYLDPDKIPKSIFELAKVEEFPNFYKAKPVSDSVFQVYKEQFAYDKSDLNAKEEELPDSSKDWIQKRITFNAAYDNDRVISYLFLPKKGSPPYQTVIYFPGSGSVFQKSSQNLDKYIEFEYHVSFLVTNGRAVLYPIYKGTFERGNDALSALLTGDWKSRQYAECLVRVVKDFKRCIDYLETRPDIDSKRLAYFGFSWGGVNGAIIPAVEDRIRASVLEVGGIWGKERPEVNVINYVTRVRIPTLMLNGRYDMTFPYETTVKPMFDLLGTPKEQKELKLYDTDHWIPRNEVIKETLNWLDRYLEPVK